MAKWSMGSAAVHHLNAYKVERGYYDPVLEIALVFYEHFHQLQHTCSSVLMQIPHALTSTPEGKYPVT